MTIMSLPMFRLQDLLIILPRGCKVREKTDAVMCRDSPAYQINFMNLSKTYPHFIYSTLKWKKK